MLAFRKRNALLLETPLWKLIPDLSSIIVRGHGDPVLRGVRTRIIVEVTPPRDVSIPNADAMTRFVTGSRPAIPGHFLYGWWHTQWLVPIDPESSIRIQQNVEFCLIVAMTIAR